MFRLGFLLFTFFSLVGMCAQLSVRNEEPTAPLIEKGKPVIVAVVDTGFDFDSTWSGLNQSVGLKKPKMCKQGHKDFTDMGIKDLHGHGTHIAGLIAKYAGDSNYCLVALKYYNTEKEQIDHLGTSLKAFQRAIDLKVDIINYSGGGVEKSEYECALIKKALDMGIIVVAAAGNEASDINLSPYYPAMCDNRVRAIANVDEKGNYQHNSNFTNLVMINPRELVKENGTNVLSLSPGNGTTYMTGTSQAAAIETGKIVKELCSH